MSSLRQNIIQLNYFDLMLFMRIMQDIKMMPKIGQNQVKYTSALDVKIMQNRHALGINQ